MLRIRLVPRSIRGRLLVAGIAFTGLALLLASVSISRVLDRFVTRGMNERLDAQIALLVRAVRPDGTIDRAVLGGIGPFTQHDRGWRWQIDAPGDTAGSGEIVPPADLHPLPCPPDDPARHDRPPRRHIRRDSPQSAEAPGLYARTLVRQTTGGAVTVTAAAPREVIDRMRRVAVTPLLVSLGALGAFLLAATLLQLQIGLRPLARLTRSLVAVRAGHAARVPADQPAELRGVVTELNALLDENEAALGRARGHVANLAHSLKTPLATLSLRLKQSGRDPDGELAALVEQVDRGIRHHLGRARAASPGAPGRPQVPLAPAVAGLVDALSHIHADRGIVAETDIAAGLAVKCDPQDLDEMLGNLLDNAWKWAHGHIAIGGTAQRGTAQGGTAVIVIDDDGPGLSDVAIAQALVPGQRLDERGDGHGFGLPIARELAELHGGTLHLGPAPPGGLRVTLTLPA